MSALHTDQKAMRQLKAKIHRFAPSIKDNVTYFFVTSYPKSDMGKGTLVAQLLSTCPDSDAIKYDGLLNTNENGRHTARGHDDFGIYEQFNPGREWGKEHYLLGGELMNDFIVKYGEYENLQINPHFSLYVESQIHEMWQSVGKPKNLFIEIGGVITDPEVDSIITPIIRRLTENNTAKTILLTESATNGEYIKTKSIQDGLSELLKRRLEPWLIVAREPYDFCNAKQSERLEFERIISDKLSANFDKRFNRIISIPFFDDLKDYKQCIENRFLPLLKTNFANEEIIIATTNNSKFEDFSIYLNDDYKIRKIDNERIEVPEGVNFIEDNALAKARAYAVITGKICIADDTGFFIDELDGEPGVAIRRWGGELGEKATEVDFWKHLQKKTSNLSSTSCYFEQCIAICSPNGDFRTIFKRTEGKLNRSGLSKPYNGTGYPLASAFESNANAKTWEIMTEDEKRYAEKELIANLKKAIAELIA